MLNTTMATGEAYWNTYTGNDVQNPDAGVNLDDVAQGLYDQGNVVEQVKKANGLQTEDRYKMSTILRNMGGENLELEVAGALVGVLDLANKMAEAGNPPFLLYLRNEGEREVVRDLMKKGFFMHIQDVDMEVRSQDERG